MKTITKQKNAFHSCKQKVLFQKEPQTTALQTRKTRQQGKKKKDKASLFNGDLPTYQIRLKEELYQQISFLGYMKEMAAMYGYDISEPASNTKEAVQSPELGIALPQIFLTILLDALKFCTMFRDFNGEDRVRNFIHSIFGFYSLLKGTNKNWKIATSHTFQSSND